MTPTRPAEAEIGYRFEPPCAHDELCHRQLGVCLPPEPTRHHYDPEAVTCSVVSDRGGPESLEIRHPWPYRTSYRLYPGRIMLRDRAEKQVEAFTFGGDVAIDSSDAGTNCQFTSSAPLIPLRDDDSLASQFTAEVEVVLAERRAHWEMQDELHQFQTRLGQAEPFALYLTCLEAVSERLEPLVKSGSHQARQLQHFVERQREQLKHDGTWPANVAPVDEAL